MCLNESIWNKNSILHFFLMLGKTYSEKLYVIKIHTKSDDQSLSQIAIVIRRYFWYTIHLITTNQYFKKSKMKIPFVV